MFFYNKFILIFAKKNNMKKLDISDLNKENLILYKYIRGSVAYNLNTEDSDVDMGGVYMSPIENVLDLGFDYQEQVSDEKNDVVFYEIKRYLHLLIKSNPNMLESLFIPKEFIIGEVHPIMQKIIDNREHFVSKSCIHSLVQYSKSQIEKARGLNKKCHVDPQKVVRKLPIDFVYTPYNQGSTNISDWLKYRGLKQEFCGVVNINNMKDFYGLHYDFGQHKESIGLVYDDNNEEMVKLTKQFIEHTNSIELDYKLVYENHIPNKIGYRGIIGENSNEIRLSSIPKGEKFICYISYNKDGYTTHCKKYKEYKDWEEKRNSIRFENNLKFNYDTKNISHCVRLLTMAKEILNNEGFNVKRTHDRDFLMAIKKGKYEYDYIMDYTVKLKSEIEELFKTSSLQEECDLDFVNGLLMDIRKEQLKLVK